MTDLEYLIATSIVPLGVVVMALVFLWAVKDNPHRHPGE
jgi:nitrogen fixation-related uncharacterized protein